MKKLMIAAAAAAMIGGAYADAVVYDASFSIKTTNCKEGTVSATLAKYTTLTKGDKFAYRAKASLKYAGVFYGCECDTIAKPAWAQASAAANTVQGFAFWNTALKDKKYQPFEIPFVDFKWVLLNRISNNYTTMEGTWMLRDTAEGEAFYFLGGGFGTATTDDTCSGAIIKSMSGNFAGWRQPDNKTASYGCKYCDPKTGLCTAWTFCACVAEDTTKITTAYGTWSIKYNSSVSKKLSNADSITEISPYTGSKYADVKAYIAAAEVATKDFLGFGGDASALSCNPSDLETKFYSELDKESPGKVTGLPKLAQSMMADADPS